MPFPAFTGELVSMRSAGAAIDAAVLVVLPNLIQRPGEGTSLREGVVS